MAQVILIADDRDNWHQAADMTAPQLGARVLLPPRDASPFVQISDGELVEEYMVARVDHTLSTWYKEIGIRVFLTRRKPAMEGLKPGQARESP